jgi:hypothetical protein
MKSNNKAGAPRGVRLNKPQDVRRLLSRLVNQVISGDMETDTLRAITYACSMILKSLETGELSERLKTLEEKL